MQRSASLHLVAGHQATPWRKFPGVVSTILRMATGSFQCVACVSMASCLRFAKTARARQLLTRAPPCCRCRRRPLRPSLRASGTRPPQQAIVSIKVRCYSWSLSSTPLFLAPGNIRRSAQPCDGQSESSNRARRSVPTTPTPALTCVASQPFCPWTSKHLWGQSSLFLASPCSGSITLFTIRSGRRWAWHVLPTDTALTVTSC
mmetsp:Transcript_95827/g.189956  ORF Transcript_95827/g.189956 Transcript_95827/m.189956 type:complete len:203 (+) Transcript_95827:1176-1784(+)